MVSAPNSDRSPGRAARAAGLFLFALLFSAASHAAVHHFDIETPRSAVLGQPSPVTVTAKAEDGAAVRAHNEILIHLTTSKGTKTIEGKLSRGVARLSITFEDLGFVIVQVTDKNDDRITNSTAVRVLPNLATGGSRK